MSFLVTGNPCGTTPDCEETFAGQPLQEAEYYILVLADKDEIAFSGVVADGSTFSIRNGFEKGKRDLLQEYPPLRKRKAQFT